ncbi:histone-like nucleoid-structuring protein Lsr2 [Occultella kanbiaonis]|uniref:histone-like nucleoid-structuring protein Lsr2 n=1 Tax=Occultella kanbiaonis TaxID=2675754 RepID=UPI0012B7F042|nr:Lsr2 family protein [Occultella kanbiaonis]
MATRTVYELVDDITGDAIADGKGETLTFGLDGVVFEIDLTLHNAAKLRDELAPWVERARRTGGRVSTGRQARSTDSGYDPKAVRVWARSASIEVPAKGRIPKAVLDQYLAAGN